MYLVVCFECGETSFFFHFCFPPNAHGLRYVSDSLASLAAPLLRILRPFFADMPNSLLSTGCVKASPIHN